MDLFEHGGDIYRNQVDFDFSINVNPFGMPEKVKEALINSINLNEIYPDEKCEKLSNAIGNYHNIDADKIICGNGASEIINNVIRVINPKKALLMAPTFSGYEKALYAVGSEVEFYMLKKENDYSIDTGVLKCLKDDLDVIFICNPNNPIGNLVNSDILLSIIKKAKEHNIYVIVDECFLPFLKNYENLSVKKYINDFDNLFILNAFTKTYAIPGLRLGYGITSNKKLIKNIKKVASDWNVSTMAQVAGVAALDETKYMEETKNFLVDEQRFMFNEFEKFAKKVYYPNANYMFFKSIPDLKEKLLERKILIRSCSNYRGLGQGSFRVAIKSHEDNINLIEVIKEVLKWQKI